jgi:hypothetical protein
VVAYAEGAVVRRVPRFLNRWEDLGARPVGDGVAEERFPVGFEPDHKDPDLRPLLYVLTLVTLRSDLSGVCVFHATVDVEDVSGAPR